MICNASWIVILNIYLENLCKSLMIPHFTVKVQTKSHYENFLLMCVPSRHISKDNGGSIGEFMRAGTPCFWQKSIGDPPSLALVLLKSPDSQPTAAVQYPTLIKYSEIGMRYAVQRERTLSVYVYEWKAAISALTNSDFKWLHDHS